MKELIEILRHLNFITTNSEEKEVVFLPTLSEFILANDLSPIRLNGGYDRVMLYTKFLTQPITLSMLCTDMYEPIFLNTGVLETKFQNNALIHVSYISRGLTQLYLKMTSLLEMECCGLER